MLSQALERRHNISRGCAWVNYVRSHDDIGWTFSDTDASALGIDGVAHRRFLNAFFVNRFPGSFARGAPFQDNPRTGDCRISGTTASLAGLEAGRKGEEPYAVDRILLAYSIAMSTGGVPLIYLGDEVGMLNDYSYVADPSKAYDSRWVHRPKYPEEGYAARHDPTTIAGRVYAGITKLIRLRKATPQFAGGRVIIFHTQNPKVLGYQHISGGRTVLCLANFSDFPEWVARERFVACPERAQDLVGENMVNLRSEGVQLRAHQYLWLYL
jgi:amylosucrase